jgi:hypothetical protein
VARGKDCELSTRSMLSILGELRRLADVGVSEACILSESLLKMRA